MTLATFWGMKAPDLVPTCTTWQGLKDDGQPIRLTRIKRHLVYLKQYRDSDEFSPENYEAEGTDTGAASPTNKPRITMDDLASLADSQWNPDFHQGLDYLWTIMDESDRKSFLEASKNQNTSTAMSTMVTIPPKASQSTVRPSEQQTQVEGQGTDVASMDPSHEQEGTEDTSGPPPQTDEVESMDTKQGEIVISEDNDQGQTVGETTLSSQLADVGSTEAGDESKTNAVDSSKPINSLRKYLIGNLNIDSYIDIFNVLSAVASRYVDPEGAFVRKLSLDGYPLQLRSSLGIHDPVIILVDAEI